MTDDDIGSLKNTVEIGSIDITKPYEFSGSHYEMGFQQGFTFKSNLEVAIKAFKALPSIKQLKPKIMPRNLFFKIASNKAYKGFSNIFHKYLPEQAERIKGIAEGSEISEKMIYLIASTEVILAERNFEIPIKSGCSSFGLDKVKMENNHSFSCRNFDYMQFIVPHLAVRINKPNGRFKTFDISATPLPGTFNGINEKGVFIGTDEASPHSELKHGLPASMLIQEALETCATSDEVFELFKKLPRGSGNCIMVNDASSNMFVMEFSSNRILKRNQNNNKNYLIATNHYQLDEIKDLNIPRNAKWGIGSDPDLLGYSILEDSYVRVETAERLLSTKDKMNVEDLKNFLRTHEGGPNNKPSRFSICRHDPVMISCASMIFDLITLEGWLTIGNPCENEYNYFDFQKFVEVD